MHRTLIQLDEPLYEQLRCLAFEKGISLSATVRELLSKVIGRGRRRKKTKVSQLKFIGCGISKVLPKDISENHDKYLEEDYLK